MTANQIRQSYLDFFKEKEHAIVPSSSLMPDSPNLLFTNAGMNQFVPIFLGNSPCPYPTGRAADTQKCIRAGGKHNDLEDVGFDTYHHTFFEMLGNWSFGNYFKKEAIEWAWELVVGRWKFPANRVYATVYKPGPGDPADFDQEAYGYWEAIFKKAGLDPAVHIVYGNKKDNFWMMGDTGPCGPCSELHIDLTPEGDTKGKLVNTGDAACMEIWNLVFIQFNANADGTFSKLPACHVDTGMGFERVAGIIQGTKNFSDFKNARISNYESDLFLPIFQAIEARTGKKYTSTLPTDPASKEVIASDIAFRVIADHLRTLSFSIADGIIPSNEGRGYVLRRILRRAMNYGRDLGLTEPFLNSLVPVIAEYFGDVFPEVRKNVIRVQDVIKAEEESFQKTIDRGLELFTKEMTPLRQRNEKVFPGEVAFELYHTYGFPIDLTQVLARREGLSVDEVAVERRKEEERKRSQAAQKKEIIKVSETEDASVATKFLGYEYLESEATIVSVGDDFIVLDQTPFYAEMGGQVGDQGTITNSKEEQVAVLNTIKTDKGSIAHRIDSSAVGRFSKGEKVSAKVDTTRRSRINAHHSVTHMMPWALREILGTTVGQKGSYVGTDRLRFDFAFHQAMTPDQVAKVESMVNEKISMKSPVSSTERAYVEVKGDPSVLQFFGDKYGDKVRVVDIGGYSKELCGGTHVKNTAEIGWFKLLGESAIAAGVRRIEALSGVAVEDYLKSEAPKQDEKYKNLKQKCATLPEFPALTGTNPEALWKSFESRQQALAKAEVEVRESEKKQAKEMEAVFQKQAAENAGALASQATTLNGVPTVIHSLGEVKSAYIPFLVDVLKRQVKGVIVLAGQDEGRVSLVASVDGAFTSKIQAGKIIQTLAPIVGGKGGGRPDLAQGGGTQPEKINEALEKAKSLI
ncbi:MAG: alanine--tRNA ligase [Verrucomicrobiota bacterium]